MKTLIAALCSLAVLGCGGLEGASTAPAGDEGAALGGTPRREAPVPTEPTELKWEVIWANEGLALQLVQVPVEERFFYPVDVNVPPPELPPPPCPSCR